MVGEDGRCYAGETDSLSDRIKRHRANKKSLKSPTVLYAVVEGGKSNARRIEKHLIDDLKKHGHAMLSDKDSRNKRFGGASARPATGGTCPSPSSSFPPSSSGSE